ncbi:hypothetical protein [Flavobacterium sp.]|uniref:hypothetical protein n=1 Tax=Flavobacterium sp. TaxID=239 RepID=UPI00248779A4|nr:hypothetical protein [Flavobacterium sp.]MDI1316272.1 hypothetical protein [Flavobacterium sp.]
MNWYTITPLFEILCGTFQLLAPSLIVLILVKQFTVNPSFQKDITYTFRENGFSVHGATFYGHIYLSKNDWANL